MIPIRDIMMDNNLSCLKSVPYVGRSVTVKCLNNGWKLMITILHNKLKSSAL